MSQNSEVLLASMRYEIPSQWTLSRSFTDREIVQVTNTFDQSNITKNINNLSYTKIYRVENVSLYAQFLIKKAEYTKLHGTAPEILELYHVTGSSAARQIAKNNFDYRKVYRYKFGKGVSFSSNVAYAKQWSSCNGSVIIADVLKGNVNNVHAWNHMELPNDGYDTNYNAASVFVKFYDNEFYPKYILDLK